MASCGPATLPGPCSFLKKFSDRSLPLEAGSLDFKDCIHLVIKDSFRVRVATEIGQRSCTDTSQQSVSLGPLGTENLKGNSQLSPQAGRSGLAAAACRDQPVETAVQRLRGYWVPFQCGSVAPGSLHKPLSLLHSYREGQHVTLEGPGSVTMRHVGSHVARL